MLLDPPSHQQCVGFVRLALPAGAALADKADVIVISSKSSTRLQKTDGNCLYEADISQHWSNQYLLHALGRLVLRENALVQGTVQQAPGVLRATLNVYIPLRLWEGVSSWKGSPAAAVAFSEIQPLGQAPDPVSIAEPDSAKQFSLSSCFLELPSYATSSTAAASPTSQSKGARCSNGLGALPDYIMSQVLSQLSHADLAAVSSTCKALRAQATHTVPGLRLHLYPHQSRALQWMLKREHTAAEMDNPCWKGLVSSGGLPCWVCTATGAIALDPPARLQDCRGGLFCDEPGLGKTITGLALISKTRGSLPDPCAGPDGTPVKCTWVKDPAGRPAAFYTVTNAGIASPTPASGAVRVSRRSSSSASKFAAKSSQGKQQSQQDSETELPCTPARRQKLSPSIGGSKGSSIPIERQTRQGLKGKEGSPEGPVGSTKGTYGGPERQTGEHLPIGSSQDAERTPAAPSVAEANYVWVQCDLCNKWRELPKGHVVSEEADWVCSMHPFASMRSCAEPEDNTIIHRFADCPGFVQQHEARGSPKNIAYFQKVLQGYEGLVKDTTSAAWWLVKQSPHAIRDGVCVPLDRKAAGWDRFLQDLGLIPTERPTQLKKKDPKTSEPSAPGSGTKRKRSAVKAKGWWKQPWQIDSLLLDTEALLSALETGPAEEEQKVYLSPATLLVLPPTLIPHWLHQIRAHMKPNTLRVAVLASDRGSAEDASSGVTYWGLGRGQPPVHHLAWEYDLVLTTFSRLSADWSQSTSSSPLKQVHWLRVILDEGHMLGASLAITNKLQMACSLRAERRWVMSGTPTPSTPTSHVAHLHPLLAFLQQQPYGSHRKTWEDVVQKPFEARQRAGRVQLMALLSRIMIRAAKADLVTIPPCHHKVTQLDFAPEHAHSYNELIEVVKLNLLLADWNDEDHNESLLSVRNSKWGKEMLRNVRLSCCVAGNCDLAVKETDVQETLELLGERLGYDPPKAQWAPWVPPTHPLAYVENALRDGGSCQHCGAVARLLVVAPCAHLFCLDCVSMDRLACPSCRQAYQMQSVSDPVRLDNNPNPKWDVPMDVIEWQCSYTQKGAIGLSGGAWSANWQITKSTKCVHLLRRLMDIGAVPNCPAAEGGGDPSRGLTKAIVFSQFWMHIQLINAHLRAHKVALALLKQDMSPKDKAAAVATFQHDPGVGVLLMDETGSVGLDLSFVSWVFLMEPLADASLQAQVTARAHRMGASQAVHVETLVMKGTAEEQMLNLGSTSPGAPCQPDSTTPAADAGATSKSEPSVFTTGTTSPCLVSSANGAPCPHVRHSPVMEHDDATSSHCTALLQESPAYGDCTQQMEGQQAVQVEEAEAEVLLGTTTGPESGQLQQPSGMLGHVAAAVEMQEQARAVKASVGVLQVPGPLQGPSEQQRGKGPTGSVQDGAMNAAQGFALRKGGLVNATQESLHGVRGQQIGGSNAKSPGERGVVHSAQGRERTEAARRGTRNSLLLSLHRVAVTDLPQFQDLPIQNQNQPL